jgi:putative membrane protein
MDWLLNLYPWTKAVHIMAVIAWMAGLFYLPRLFVHHAERAEPGSTMSETFKMMEVKLYRQIMNPAMIAVWVLGLLLVATPGVVDLRTDGWFHAKFLLVGVMTWYHHWCGRRRKEFAADRNTRSGRYYRIMNEVPTALMAGIVILVVVKPF